MRDRMLLWAAALARLVMVVVAFGLAVGSIGLASVRGFCPEVEDASALAGPTGAVALAGPTGAVALATIVQEPGDGDAPPVDPDSPAPDGQAPGGPGGVPTEQPVPEGTEAPADDADGAGDQDGTCPGAVQRCLPPLVSSILIVGDPSCHDQAGGRLRAILVPAFVGSTVLLAGAWWLRPTRLQERLDRPRQGARHGT